MRLRRTACAVSLALLAGCGTTVSSAPVNNLPLGSGEAPLSAPSGSLPDKAGQVAGSAVATKPTPSGEAQPGSSPGLATTTGSNAGGGRAASAVTNHRPIEVGLLYNDFTAAARQTGVAEKEIADPSRAFHALVRAINAGGGLDGRRIIPVYYRIDGLTRDYSTSAQAACAAFTQDHHVEAVVSINFTWDNLSNCLAQAGVAQFDGAPWTGHSEAELARYPAVYWSGAAAIDRYARMVLSESVRTKWVTTHNKVGVLEDGCSGSTSTYDHVVQPLASSLKIPIEGVVAFDCVNGASDIGKIESGLQSAAFKFRADGIDRVMYLTDIEGLANTYFAQNAHSQQWHPGYMVSSVGILQLQASQIPADQLPNMHGVGWVPILDVTHPAPTTQSQRCLALDRKGGDAAPASQDQTAWLLLTCDPLFLLEAALGADGGIGGLAALSEGVRRLGTSYVAVGALGGATDFGNGRHDGVAEARAFGYNAHCACFRPLAAPVPVR